MKLFNLVWLLFFAGKSTIAQKIEMDTKEAFSKEVTSKWQLNAFYLNLNLGRQFSDKYLYADFSCKFHFVHGWGAAVGLSGYTTKSENVPRDYSMSVLSLICKVPGNNTAVYSFRLLREFDISERPIRFGFEIGPELVETRDAIFVLIPSTILNVLGTNYDVKRYPLYSMGGVFVAKFEARLNTKVGFVLELYTHQNNHHSSTGLSFGICVGMVGPRN
jgi:hypothetical protein